MAQDKGLLFFYDWQEAFEALTGDECKALLLAMLDYRREGIKPPAFEGGAKIAAAFIFPAIDRSIERALSGRKGGLSGREKASEVDSALSELEAKSKLPSSSGQAQDKTKTKTKTKTETIECMADKPPKARAQPPALDEVKAYCRERRSTVSAEAFFDFYEANGWKQGQGKPIKDWKAAVRTWERRDRETGKTAVPAENNPDEIFMPF